MKTLKEYAGQFDSKADAARRLGWERQHLNERLNAKKQVWICEKSKKWFIEGGRYE